MLLFHFVMLHRLSGALCLNVLSAWMRKEKDWDKFRFRLARDPQEMVVLTLLRLLSQITTPWWAGDADRKPVQFVCP
jgi:hypothetical protein